MPPTPTGAVHNGEHVAALHPPARNTERVDPATANTRELLAARDGEPPVPAAPVHCGAPVASSNAWMVPLSSMTATEVLPRATIGARGSETGCVHDGAHVPAHPVGRASTVLPCVVSQWPLDRVALPKNGRLPRSPGVGPQAVAGIVRFQAGARVPSKAVMPMFTVHRLAQPVAGPTDVEYEGTTTMLSLSRI